MNRCLAPLLLAIALSGCATFEPSELAQMRGRGVSPRVMSKLDDGRPIAPADVIELTRRGIADTWIIRQIEDHGVDSMITRSDVTALRRAGARPAVIDAMLRASDAFERDFRSPDYWSAGWYYGDPYFAGVSPWGWYGSGFGASIVVPAGHHHHHHHW